MGAVNTIDKPVLFFDGVCNLCNTSVQFIIDRDKSNRFHFSSLQSQFAKDALPKEFTIEGDYQSLVLKNGEEILSKSSAVLEVSRHLSGLWSALYFLIIIPKPIRDYFYSIVAKNRYKWFGKKNECMIPTRELQARFIE